MTSHISLNIFKRSNDFKMKKNKPSIVLPKFTGTKFDESDDDILEGDEEYIDGVSFPGAPISIDGAVRSFPTPRPVSDLSKIQEGTKTQLPDWIFKKFKPEEEGDDK